LLRIHPTLVAEEVGNDVVVMDSETQSVLSISGIPASVIKRVLAGEPVEGKESGVSELVSQGILVTEAASTVSRRTLMVSGAAMSVGGVLALSLPVAAFASSTPALLAAPVFTTVEGETRINRRNIGRDDADDQLTRLRFDAVRLDNPEVFGPGYKLEWSFSESGEYREFTLSDSQYEWEADQDDSPSGYVKLPDDPGLSPNDADGFYTIFIRVREGDLVSAPVAVVFEFLD
jgi:hypothetical protein